MNNLERIVNLDGTITERELSKSEIEARLLEKQKSDSIIAQEEIKAAAKAALLERLGITEEEAKLLLG